MDSNLFTKDLAADYLDCVSDYFEQEQEAIRETTPEDWQLIEQPDDLSP
jgi:hypothetical protein